MSTLDGLSDDEKSLSDEEPYMNVGEGDPKCTCEDVIETCENNDKYEAISKISIEEIEIAFPGMCFKSEEEAYAYYNDYALKKGFSIRRYKTRCKNGLRFYRSICCSNEGVKMKSQDQDVKNPRLETRTGCMAMIGIELIEASIWKVKHFRVEHNHTLLPPDQAFMLRSHRKVGHTWETVIDLAEQSGMKPKVAYEFMSRQTGGAQCLGFLPEDHLNHIHSKRKQSLHKGDAMAVLGYLKNKKLKDPAFHYDIQYDDDCKITNIFWADSKSISDYHYFGDVVCFDTTYKTNNHGRPLGVFVGINHHKKTTIFGAALLYDETIPSFEWLFSTFLRTMSRLAPKTILTDQDQAMACGIKSVLPNTHHRICIWHMYQNACKHLSQVFNRVIDGKKPFSKDFKKCIYDFEDEEKFEATWVELLHTYKLEDNEWLQGIYGQKKKWALVYGRNTFCGGMHSTQRSERMNRTLKVYFNNKESLLKFFGHYERVLADQRYKELRADCKAAKGSPQPIMPSPTLQHASIVYTPAVYRMVQDEYIHICNYRIVGHKEDKGISEYNVRGVGTMRKEYLVTIKPLTEDIRCTCRKFEFIGIFCKHVYVVFQHLEIMQIPSKYILRRWKKGVKESLALNINSEPYDPNSDAMKVKMHNDLFSALVKICTDAIEYEETFKIALSCLENMAIKVNACKKRHDMAAHDVINDHTQSQSVQSLDDESQFNTHAGGNQDLHDSATSPIAKGIKRRIREKGQHRIKSCLEKRRRKKPNPKVSAKKKMSWDEQDTRMPIPSNVEPLSEVGQEIQQTAFPFMGITQESYVSSPFEHNSIFPSCMDCINPRVKDSQEVDREARN